MTNIELYALEGKSFDVTTYRGYAKLSDLARISQADVYAEDINPGGIQRDLNKKHASEAYYYASKGQGKLGEYKMWPEVVLNVRDEAVVKKEKIPTAGGQSLTKLTFNLDKIKKDLPRPQVSRVDGNHRLYYASGDDPKFPPVEEVSPFSITIGLSVMQEQTMFADVNDNQKGMNTSHLHNIIFRSAPEEQTMRDDPALWIAEKLHENSDSPFLGLVYRGGSRSQGSLRYINLTSFKNGIDLLLNSGKALNAIPGTTMETVPAKYLLIRNYWNAVKKVYSSDWNDKTLLLKGVGYRAMSVVGGSIIDRCLSAGHTDTNDMEPLVEMTRTTKFDSGKTLDWSSHGPVSSYGGMKGVSMLSDLILQSIAPVNQGTVRTLSEKAGVLPETTT